MLRRFAPLVSALALTTGSLAALAQPAAASPISAPTVQWTRTVGGAIQESSPVVANLDGQKDVVVGSLDGNLYAFRGSNGANVSGWPRQLGTGIDASPSVADAFHSGSNQVFVGTGTPAARSGDFYALNADGSTRWKFHPSDNDFPSLSMFSSPAIGDVNGDGTADVSAFSLGLLGWSFSADGATNGGWPFYQDDTVFSSPALYDVDGDGKPDYVVGGDSTAGGPVDHRGGFLRALRGDGSLIWSFPVDEMVRSSPVVADITGDGVPEIIFGTGDYWVRQPGGAGDSTKLFVLDLQGHLKWSRDLGGYTPGTPAVADIDHDGKRDVIMGTWGTDTTRNLWVFNGDGSTNPHFGPLDDQYGPILSQVTTADFNNDGYQDVFATTGGGALAFSGATGEKLFNLPSGVSFQNAAWIGDLDDDGKLDIVVAGEDHGTHQGVITDYEFGSTTARLGTNGWSQFRGNARLTGTTAPVTLNQDYCGGTTEGYYMVARDGGVFSYCNAAFYGSMGGHPLNQPIVGIAPTPSHHGYWEVASDGGIFAYGDARFHGSANSYHPGSPIVGIASTPSGNGYWEVAADGSVYAFGDAGFFGSMGGHALNRPIVAMAPTPNGNGYWLVADDGGIFAFGGAQYKGSMGGQPLNRPIVGITCAGTDHSYWMVASDGGIFAYGGAPFRGSTGSLRLNQPIVGMTKNVDSSGYRLVASDGGIFAFGASFLGSTGAIKLNQPIVGMGS